MEETLSCGLCRHSGSDVRLQGCGCTIHAKCLPLNLIASKTNLDAPPKAAEPNTVPCPACRSALVEGIYLFPMQLADLDRAVQLRKMAAKGKAAKPSVSPMNDNGKRERDAESEFQEVQAESSYLLLSHSQASAAAADAQYQRTGRWTDEETAYVDLVLEAFDRGQLPIPEGMKLNDFLRDLLLCKSSRLTKKMKHAKLSARKYTLDGESIGAPGFNRDLMSSLEEEFLKSITSAPVRLELRFNLTKAWRTFFSNLCLQVGSSMLIANDWIEGLEVMERRAIAVEEALRKARRRRMGMALKTDSRTTNSEVFFSGMPVMREQKKTKTEVSDFRPPSVVDSSSAASTSAASVTSEDHSENDFISNMLDLGPPFLRGSQRQRSNSLEDFASIFDDLATTTLDATMGPSVDHVRNNSAQFLSAMASLIESQNLPFQHVDIWVPSPDANNPGKVRLFHAGHATRHDVDPALFFQLNEYGDYSTRFSFAPGVGLPGRVYVTGQHSWERRIDQADPKIFERAGGARVYGIKTGFGIPVNTNVIGRIVVSMYSTDDIMEDSAIVAVCKAELAKYTPGQSWEDLFETEKPAQTVSVSSPMIAPMSRVTSNSIDYRDYTKPVVSVAHYHHQPPAEASSAPSIEQSPGINHRTVSIGSRGSCANAAILSNASPAIDACHEEEMRIASVLGNHIPLNDLPRTGESTESWAVAPESVVPLFMSLRLLLLRSPARRSEEENEMMDIIRKSCQGYTQDSRRSEKDVAYLLVKDWQYLKASLDANKKPAPKADDEHQCHVMDAPRETYAASGAPPRMPTLPSLESNRRYGAMEGVQSERLVSPSDNDSMTVPSYNVNIVDEH